MVHYIRFLRTPRVNETPKKSLLVAAVATVTTDLGDSFYGQDVGLIANLVDATGSGQVLHTQNVIWQDGFRAIKLQIQCNAKLTSRLVRLHLTTQQTTSSLAAIEVPEVLDVWSEAFKLKDRVHTDTINERQLQVSNKCTIRQWEVTGDSIARHIWDAGLGFLMLFQRLFNGSASHDLPSLHAVLNSNITHRLKVLELGAGCGTVGIMFSQLRKSTVLLTDLEDAQEILQRNMDCASPLAGSVLHRQVLGWGPNMEELVEPRFDLVLVSDCIYNPDSSLLLVETLQQVSKNNQNLLILLGFKRRHDADDIFFERMQETGFIVVEQCIQTLPHTMTDYDVNAPQIEMFVYRASGTS